MKQDVHKFKASLGYIMKLCFKEGAFSLNKTVTIFKDSFVSYVCECVAMKLSIPAWVLGMQRTEHTLNHQAISPALYCCVSSGCGGRIIT